MCKYEFLKNFSNNPENPEKVIVEFYSDTCGPCQTMEPIVRKIAENDPGLNIKKVDVLTNPELCDSLGIRRVPSFVIFKNGEEIARRHGVCTFGEMEKFVKTE